MDGSRVTELVPGLPEELGLECLARLPCKAYGTASGVCHRWRQLLRSQEFYYYRRKFGYTRKVACLVQAVDGAVTSEGRKSSSSPGYAITVFDPVNRTWDLLDPIPQYPSGLPLFCQLASCEGKLVVVGGWDPASYDPVVDIFVYDFRIQNWRQGKEMPSKRSFFAIGASSGRVYVAGGHDENKNALRSAWVYDLDRDEWSELRQMSQERDECEGMVIGDEFWVLSGYRTDNQGMFEGSAEVYGFGSGEWWQVEGTWESGRCPRSCVGLRKDGRWVNWAELDSAVRVGTCAVPLGGRRVLIVGSEYQGAPHGFYMVEDGEGRNIKLQKIDVPAEFSGFVQSGCCVET